MRIKSILIRYFAWIALCLVTTAFAQPYPRGTHQIVISVSKGVRANTLQNIAPIIEKSIAAGGYPGAVILIGHRGHIIYRGVFGNRRIVPSIAPMRFDTIFDVASMTKVVATAPAIMQLVEQGKLALDAPVAKYWSAFANHGKEKITIRELLTHTSDLPAAEISNLAEIAKLPLETTPGSKFIYSDINFIILAHLVEIISHQRFDQYVRQHIFQPLRMKNTFFLPPRHLRERIAPTEMMDNHLRWGTVHDPLAFAMGGVSGHAGVFSTAYDLSLYAQCLLKGGKIAASRYLLGPLTVLKMTTPQTSQTNATRGLGWDIDSAYSNRGVLFPIRSYGHTGWTGTSLWIDPVTQTWIIILTSRTHPIPAQTNQIVRDRQTIANIVAASITDVNMIQQKNTHIGELARAYS